MTQRAQPLNAPLVAGFGGVLRPRTRMGRMARAILRTTAVATITGLAAFHGWLFWDRLAGGDLLDPSVAARWVAAGLLLALLLVLRRLGAPLLLGRRALVVWLLVALLHWNAGATAPSLAGPGPQASTLIFVLPTAVGALVGLGLVAAALAARRPLRPILRCLCTLGPSDTSRPTTGWPRGGPARAPPLALA